MNISKYIIKQPLSSGEVLLFSTYSTALIKVCKDVYERIFKNNEFDDIETIAQLQQLGFIVEDDYQEKTLERLTEQELYSGTPVIKIFSTNKCNARFYYCFEKGIRQVEMNDETANQIVSFIKDNYTQSKLQINWFGGEPLYNFGVIKSITKGLREAGYQLQTHITTNGSLVNLEVIDFLKKYYDGISIQITIDDIDEKYSKIKRYINIPESEAYATVIDNIHLLLQFNIPTRIRINFRKSEVDYAFEIFHSLKLEFPDDDNLTIYFAPLSIDGDKDVNKTEHTHLKLMSFYNDNNIKLRQENNQKSILSDLSLKPKSISCSSCKPMNITITADGNIFKCHRLAKNEIYKIGDIWNGIDNECYNNRIFISSEFISKKCKDCNIYPICRGGCKVTTHIMNNQEQTCSVYSKHSQLIEMYYNKLLEMQ